MRPKAQGSAAAPAAVRRALAPNTGTLPALDSGPRLRDAFP